MSTDSEFKKSTDLLLFLKNHIDTYAKLSFNDLSFSIEVIIKDLLNILDDANYINTNKIKYNYPAIDLHDVNKGIAIQVTTTANKAKIDHTLKLYDQQKMDYKELIIIGFVRSTSYKIDRVRVFDIHYLLDKIKYSSHAKILKVNSLLERELPLHRLSPLKDEYCLEILLTFLNRSAIRDSHLYEGSYEDMITGLKDVKQVIYTGKLNGKTISSKSIYQFSESIQHKLEKIELEISNIIRAFNNVKNNNNHKNFSLPLNVVLEIDDGKKIIAKLANELAEEYDLKLNINAC